MAYATGFWKEMRGVGWIFLWALREWCSLLISECLLFNNQQNKGWVLLSCLTTLLCVKRGKNTEYNRSLFRCLIWDGWRGFLQGRNEMCCVNKGVSTLFSCMGEIWVKSNAWLRQGYTFAIDWGFEQLFAPSRICSVNWIYSFFLGLPSITANRNK